MKRGTATAGELMAAILLALSAFFAIWIASHSPTKWGFDPRWMSAAAEAAQTVLMVYAVFWLWKLHKVLDLIMAVIQGDMEGVNASFKGVLSMAVKKFLETAEAIRDAPQK